MTQPTTLPADAAARKAALRRAALAARAMIPDDARLMASETLAKAGAALVARHRPTRVSAFASIRGEIDTAPLLARLAADGVPLCLPVIVGKDQPLLFRAWAPGEALESKTFGVLEPAASAPEVVPDLLFVPLAAFDSRGFRLGYGGGFYDRTLEGLRARGRATAIGLAFSAQQVAEAPVDAWDEPLDGVLTENGFLSTSGALA